MENDNFEDLMIMSEHYGACKWAVEEITSLRAALRWIADQENLLFAECSLAEAIVARARDALDSRARSLLERQP